MCSPAIAAVGLGIAQGGAQIMGQSQMASAQARSQSQASAAERRRYLNEVSSMRIQQRQEQIAAAQRIRESAVKAQQARSTARVSAGEAGVSGISVDALINDLTREEASYRFATNEQTKMNDVNRTLQLRDAGLGFQNNMLRINRPIEQPDYLSASLSSAQTGLSTYSTLK